MLRWLKRRWHSKQELMQHALRDTYIYHILGERIFDHHIWGLDRNSFAGGVSLGLFVAFTPTIPFQMFLCAVGAILLRVNMPVSLAACWVTNPLTALPIYLAARRLGRYLLEYSSIKGFILDFFSFEGHTARFMEQGLYLWSGSLIFSVASAFLGYIVVHIVWRLSHLLKGKMTGDNEKEDSKK